MNSEVYAGPENARNFHPNPFSTEGWKKIPPDSLPYNIPQDINNFSANKNNEIVSESIHQPFENVWRVVTQVQNKGQELQEKVIWVDSWTDENGKLQTETRQTTSESPYDKGRILWSNLNRTLDRLPGIRPAIVALLIMSGAYWGIKGLTDDTHSPDGYQTTIECDPAVNGSELVFITSPATEKIREFFLHKKGTEVKEPITLSFNSEKGESFEFPLIAILEPSSTLAGSSQRFGDSWDFLEKVPTHAIGAVFYDYQSGRNQVINFGEYGTNFIREKGVWFLVFTKNPYTSDDVYFSGFFGPSCPDSLVGTNPVDLEPIDPKRPLPLAMDLHPFVEKEEPILFPLVGTLLQTPQDVGNIFPAKNTYYIEGIAARIFSGSVHQITSEKGELFLRFRVPGKDNYQLNPGLDLFDAEIIEIPLPDGSFSYAILSSIGGKPRLWVDGKEVWKGITFDMLLYQDESRTGVVRIDGLPAGQDIETFEFVIQSLHNGSTLSIEDVLPKLDQLNSKLAGLIATIISAHRQSDKNEFKKIFTDPWNNDGA